MNLKVECIWCKTKTDFNRFARETKKSEEYDKFKNQIISYNEIGDRLSKSDPYGNTPSETLVALHIQKLIRNLVNKNRRVEEEVEEDQTAKVTYLLKNLNQENVLNFKNFINEIADGVEFELVVINREDKLDPKVLSKFDSVRIVDNDKT
jgi:hypothetical protein